MKYLIFILLISVSCFANFMSKSDIEIINNKQGNGKQFTYTTKSSCEKSGQECFDITNCKPHEGCKVIQVDVDDTDKPIYKLVEDKQLREKYEKEKADKEAAKLLKKSKKDAAREMLKVYDFKDYNFCKLLKDYLEL